nr:MAG TPA: hypothetical protein [Bacteriophage sp.]
MTAGTERAGASAAVGRSPSRPATPVTTSRGHIRRRDGTFTT